MTQAKRRHRFPVALIVLIALIAPLDKAHATWYSFGVENGAEIIMFEARWPYWPQGTYFSFWNTQPYPKGGYLYGGIATYGKGENATPAQIEAANRHEVWSFWPSKDYKGNRTRVVALGNPFTGGTMSGEGTEAGIHSGKLPFLKPKRWYKMVMRSWQDPDTPETKGYMGWWMHDTTNITWHMVGVVSVPVKITGLKGAACFVEKTGPKGKRIIDRRLAYQRLKGTWKKLDTISQKKTYPSTWHIVENGTVFRYEGPMPKGHKHNAVEKNNQLIFKLTNQPDQPTLGTLRINTSSAMAYENQLVVNWNVPKNSVPQLAYQIDVYAGTNGKGTLLRSIKEAMPHVSLKRLDLPSRATSVKLTVYDIFDQPTTTIIPVKSAAVQTAVNVTDLTSGLGYRYYEGDWKALPRLNALTPRKQGNLNSIEDSVTQGKKTSYAFSFNGYLNVPSTGAYTFKLRTCDGSRLTIGNKVIADNDGIHTTVTHLSSAFLTKGLHRFNLEYFRGKHGIGLRDKLDLQWAGPGFDYRRVGPNDLSCTKATSVPVASLVHTITTGNKLTVTQRHQLKGRKFSKLEIFTGTLMLGVVDNATVKATFVLPAGKQTLWGRLWYDDGRSVDSVETPVLSKDNRSSSWQYAIPGEQKLPLAVSSSKKSVAVTGDGSLFAYRKIKGDFTMTANIEEISRSSKANGIAGNSLMGILATDKPKSLWAQNASFGLWDTAGLWMRGTACDRDLETSRQSRHALDNKKPWIRISRKGRLWTGYTSADGKTWKRVCERIWRHERAELNVGVIFAVRPPGKNKTLFSGNISKITITDTAFELPFSKPELTVKKGQYVGIACSPKTPSILYVRTAGNGLLKSTNGGKTLKPLTVGKSIRTIAVSPANPTILLAGGSSGLYRSTDSGNTWTNVTKAVDSDDSSKNVLYGETISFNPHNPNQVAAGGKTSGLHISSNAGKTWTYSGLKGERITVVAFSPYNKKLLIVGTAGSKTIPGKIYTSTNGGKNLTVFAEKNNWTVTNIAFEAIPEGGQYLYFTTSSGIYYCYNLGQYLHQYRAQVTPDTFYTAITSWKAKDGRNRILALPVGESTIYSGRIGYFWHIEWKKYSQNHAGSPKGITCLASVGDDGKTVYAAAPKGLFMSKDQGRNFKLLTTQK